MHFYCLVSGDDGGKEAWMVSPERMYVNRMKKVRENKEVMSTLEYISI